MRPILSVLIGFACSAMSVASAQDSPMPKATAKPMAKPTTAPAPAGLGTLPPGVGVEVGQPAPPIDLPDPDGKRVTLAALLAKGPTLVVFYRGGWCPYCNYQIRKLSTHATEFAKLGLQVVAVSVDRPDREAVTRATWKIPFPVLSDPEATVHTAWRVVHQVGAAEAAKLKSYGIDIEAASGQTHHKIAIPSMFLVDADGKVRWAHADTDYKTRPTVEQVLEAVRPILAR